MALPPATNEAFLREVDDELRRDQLVDLWRRWGRWAIGGIVAALAIFAGVLVWQNRREASAGREGEQLSAAYDALGNQQLGDASSKLASLAGSSREGYRVMATFAEADVLLQQKKDAAAAAKFATIAADSSTAQPFRDLALIRQTAAEFDQLKPSVIVERMRPLAVVGSAWLGSAGELLAAAYVKEGRPDLARPLFGQIAQGEDVPPSLRQRAVQMAGATGTDAAPAGAASNGEAKAK